jgi:hypothetical protein
MEIEQIKKDMETIKRYAGKRTNITIKDNYYRCECEFKECMVAFLVSYGKSEEPYGITIEPKSKKLAKDIIGELLNEEDNSGNKMC